MVGILVKSVKCVWGVYVSIGFWLFFFTFFSPSWYQFELKLIFIIWLELLDHEMPRAVRRSQLKQLKPKV